MNKYGALHIGLTGASAKELKTALSTLADKAPYFIREGLRFYRRPVSTG